MSDLVLVRMFLRDTIIDRAKHRLPAEFPFTGGHVQRMARRRGIHVGEHRALRMVRDLVAAKDIVRVGSYRQEKSHRAGEGNFRVALYQLPGTLLRKKSASVRRRRRVKGVSWWRHPLFGDRQHARLLPGRLRRWGEPEDRWGRWS